MEQLDGDIDYGFHLTMNEVLGLVVDHCERARDTDDRFAMGIHIKMASRAMRCALEIYGDRFATQSAEPEVKK